MRNKRGCGNERQDTLEKLKMIMTKLTTIITMVVKVMIMKMMMAVRIVVVMVIQVVEVKMRMTMITLVTMILRCPIMRQNLDLGASYYIQLFVRTKGHLATFISVHFST